MMIAERNMMRGRRVALVLGSVFALMLSPIGCERASGERPDAQANGELVEALRRAVTLGPGGGATEGTVRGLRLLGDRELRPLFEALTESESAGLRRHGILGLAETSEPARIAPALVRRAKSEAERAAILGLAMQLDLLGKEQMREVLAWDDVGPDIEAAMIGGLVEFDDPVDLDRLRVIAGGASLSARAIAGLVLIQEGDADAGVEALVPVLALKGRERRAALGTLLGFIRQRDLDGAAAVAASIAEDENTGLRLRVEAVRTLMTVAPGLGEPIFARAYAQSGNPATQMMMALAALDALAEGSGVSPSLFDVVRSEQADGAGETLDLLAGAGRALASGEGAGVALGKLVASGYGPGIGIAVRLAERLTDDEGVLVWVATLRASETHAGSRHAEQAAMEAAELLAERAPGALKNELLRLAEAEDDRMCSVMLAGALRADGCDWRRIDPGVSWPDRSSRGLAALVRARSVALNGHGKGDDSLLEEVRSIALGSGGLGAAFRAQAAWLALRLEGRAQSALSQAIAEAE